MSSPKHDQLSANFEDADELHDLLLFEPTFIQNRCEIGGNLSVGIVYDNEAGI